jgi:hypothetical protein
MLVFVVQRRITIFVKTCVALEGVIECGQVAQQQRLKQERHRLSYRRRASLLSLLGEQSDGESQTQD